MAPRPFQGVPGLVYGTAFAFDETTILVEAALKAGFRGIDTAGALGAYREKLVGDGIRLCVESGITTRSDIFVCLSSSPSIFLNFLRSMLRKEVCADGVSQLQTKFSPFKPGKDPSLYPYDTSAEIETQVRQSISASLANLGTDYIDCLVLHSLYADSNDTLRAWRAMEALVPDQVGLLGVSNTDLVTLQRIYDHAGATTKPATVQNRFTQATASDPPDPKMPPGIPYPEDKYDTGVRAFCADHRIKYTPWGVLWGSPELLEGSQAGKLDEIACEIGVTKQVTFFACMQDLSLLDGLEVSVLCGTKKQDRMSETVDGLRKVREFLATSDENRKRWSELVNGLRNVIRGAVAC